MSTAPPDGNPDTDPRDAAELAAELSTDEPTTTEGGEGWSEDMELAPVHPDDEPRRRDDVEHTGERLQKVLARAGVASRRVVEDMIDQGRISVNGEQVRVQGMRVDPHADRIAVDGARIELSDDRVTYALNKPFGVLTAMSDDRGRQTIGDMVGDLAPGLVHVGRLDQDTEGLLLITNDGELAHRLAHPSYEVPKTYLAQVSGSVPRDLARRLRSGVELDDGPGQGRLVPGRRHPRRAVGRRGGPARGAQAHRPAAAGRGRAAGVAADPHRRRPHLAAADAHRHHPPAVPPGGRRAQGPRRALNRPPGPRSRRAAGGPPRLVRAPGLPGGRSSERGECMAVRAIRGATQVDADDREEILAATRELVSTVMERNDLHSDDVISILFTATPDLTSEFPALAARELGMGEVPLICATEIDVPHALPRVLRLMAHVETPLERSAVQHVYLRGAVALRRDIAQ